MSEARLAPSALDALAPTIHRSAVPRAQLTIGIVHLGLGNFARAHQLAYTEAAMAASGVWRWATAGVSLVTAGTVEKLAPQLGLYTLLVRDTAGVQAQLIEGLTQVLFAPRDAEAVTAQIAAATTAIITLTITEKGYCIDAATGGLDRARDEIAHDRRHVDAAPRSALGWLRRGLSARMQAQAGPITVISCDNLRSNGRALQRVLTEFCADHPALSAWMAANVAFPCTMVDRIVPATTEADVQQAQALCTLHDAAPVACEPFTQWVIEDRFAGPRPAWERAGVQFVADVGPYEMMKLRLLNAAHSTLAYSGYLAGYETVADAMDDETLAALAERVMRAAVVTLPASIQGESDAYITQLLARFRNRALKHRTAQIAMDGSLKLPVRVLDTVRDLLAMEADTAVHAFTVAVWMRYVFAEDEAGQKIDLRDPLAAQFAQLKQRHAYDALSFADALFALPSIFGEDIAHAITFKREVKHHLSAIFRDGTLAAAHATISQ
jgi:fructuronate reductase